MLENKSNEKIDALDFVINCLVEHEKKLDQFIDLIEGKAVWLNPEEVEKTRLIQLHDKRGPHWRDLGNITQKKQKMNSVELSTDKGYILCLSCDYTGILPSSKDE